MSGAVAIVVAAGSSSRLGGAIPKQFLDLGGETLVARAVRGLAACPEIDGVLVVLAPTDVVGAHAAELRRLPGVRGIVAGGSSRMRSALAGVAAAEDADVVLVHDAARPFVAPSVVAAVVGGVVAHGAAVPAVPVRDTVKRGDERGFVDATLDREPLRLAQTPQGARRAWLLDALESAVRDGVECTDEAQALERAGRRVAIVAGDPGNLKVTTSADLDEARRRIARPEPALRIGHGYDVHAFGGDRALVLGGVVFPGEPGLAGHSDADVVLHAAMDAVLGAAGLADIGHLFPPSDPRHAGADSRALARTVAASVASAGWRAVNVDITVLAERPRIAGRLEAMKESIGACFGLGPECVGVKATTLEGLGALGRGEGIACHAVALVRRDGDAA